MRVIASLFLLLALSHKSSSFEFDETDNIYEENTPLFRSAADLEPPTLDSMKVDDADIGEPEGKSGKGTSDIPAQAEPRSFGLQRRSFGQPPMGRSPAVTGGEAEGINGPSGGAAEGEGEGRSGRYHPTGLGGHGPWHRPIYEPPMPMYSPMPYPDYGPMPFPDYGHMPFPDYGHYPHHPRPYPGQFIPPMHRPIINVHVDGQHQQPGYGHGQYQKPGYGHGQHQKPGYGHGQHQQPGYGHGQHQKPGYGQRQQQG